MRTPRPSISHLSVSPKCLSVDRGILVRLLKAYARMVEQEYSARPTATHDPEYWAVVQIVKRGTPV